MLDIKLIRENPKLVEGNLKKRNEDTKKLKELIEIDKERRELIQKTEKLKQRRNILTREISKLKLESKTVSKKLREVKEIPDKIKNFDIKLKKLNDKSNSILMKLPNILHESVPIGKDEKDNVEIRKWGKPPKFDFEPKSHLEILENLKLIDSTNASRVSGAGFYFLKKELVLLNLALQGFAIDFLIKKGFTLIEPPYMVNKRTYEAMIGDPTDFVEASYKIDGEELYLIPTAEYPLGGIFIDTTLNKGELPVKLVGVSPCFRREIGTHGKYAKGLFRMHQFNKVEQFVFCLPEDSWEFFEEIQKNCEELYQKLGLHYRVVNVCTGDIGIKAAKKLDTEVWMADSKFREIGSNSNCTDYQARSLNIKYREKEGKPPAGFVHTLNNTAIATSRTMIAILEQFQQKDGSVLIPKVLHPYMNVKKLEKKF